MPVSDDSSSAFDLICAEIERQLRGGELLMDAAAASELLLTVRYQLDTQPRPLVIVHGPLFQAVKAARAQVYGRLIQLRHARCEVLDERWQLRPTGQRDVRALLLRSPLAGLVVVGTIATSYICALGASVVIWKHILGDNLHWSVLPIAFVLLISVGSAYNLLFALRIREESSAGPRTSVIRAFAATGMVVTAAGIVFGTTMFALAASTSLSVAQIGVTVGMGLLLDALVIRGFVLPALMVLLGRWLWWPRRSVSNRQVPEPSPA